MDKLLLCAYLHIAKHLETCISNVDSVCAQSSLFCFYILQFSKILCNTLCSMKREISENQTNE